MFYPDASDGRCEAALVLDVDPVGLVPGKDQAQGPPDQYLNDRPYAAFSFLSVALNEAFRTARTGVCNVRQELAGSAIPLEAAVMPYRSAAEGQIHVDLVMSVTYPVHPQLLT